MGPVPVDVCVGRRCRWAFRGGARRNGAQVGGRSGRRCRGRAFTALSRVSLHGREGLRRLDGRGLSARPQSLSRRCSWVRGACSCISREGLPEHALLLLRHGLCLRLRAVLPRYRLGAAIAAGVPRLVVFAEQLDKVAWKQPNHAPVALQPAHPPGPVAGIEHLDQIALDEAEIALCLYGRSGGQGCCRQTKGFPSQLTSPPHEYTALHQHGNRVGSACPAMSAALCYCAPAMCPRMRYGPRFTRRATATCVCLRSERATEIDVRRVQKIAK